MTNPFRYLLVDEEPAIRLALKLQIKQIGESYGFEQVVDEARSVDEAIGIINGMKQEYSLAIVDLRLPTKGAVDINGGFSVLDHLGNKFPEAKTAKIVVSVRTDAQAETGARKRGADYFPKPWDKSALTMAVKKAFDPHKK